MFAPQRVETNGTCKSIDEDDVFLEKTEDVNKLPLNYQSGRLKSIEIEVTERNTISLVDNSNGTLGTSHDETQKSISSSSVMKIDDPSVILVKPPDSPARYSGQIGYVEPFKLDSDFTPIPIVANVSFIRTWEEIYVHMDKKELWDLEKLIRHFIKTSFPEKLSYRDLKPGILAVTKHSGIYKRIEVVSLSTIFIHVNFIDYGNDELIGKSEVIYDLPDILKQCPALAICFQWDCGLLNYNPFSPASVLQEMVKCEKVWYILGRIAPGHFLVRSGRNAAPGKFLLNGKIIDPLQHQRETDKREETYFMRKYEEQNATISRFLENLQKGEMKEKAVLIM